MSHSWEVAELGFEHHSLATEFTFITTTRFCLIYKYNLQILNKLIWGLHAEVFVSFLTEEGIQ